MRSNKMKKKQIKILIVDDHPALCFGLKSLFQRYDDLWVAGEAANGEEALAQAKRLKPDVILLDLALPKKSGLEVIKEIKEKVPTAKIVVFSSFSDGKLIFNSLQSGASGYLLKDTPAEDIIQSIREVYEGKPQFNKEIEAKLIDYIQHDHSSNLLYQNLTDREQEVLKWVARGFNDKEIAKKTNISEGTVRCHVSNMMHKLELKNRAQVVLYAIKNGLVKLNDKI